MSETPRSFETPALRAQDTNPYLFGDPATDRARLEAQTALFSRYLQQRAHEFAGPHVTRILDLGCGEGQLTFVLSRLFRSAQVIGIDKDTRAIARAEERAAKMEMSNTTFVVGNVEEALPPGPFDLIYASLIFLHTRRPAALMRRCHDHLAPGGHLWIKDLHPSIETACDYPAYLQLMAMVFSTLLTIGAAPYLFRDAPAMLAAAGFEEPRIAIEEYPLGGATPEGRAMLGVTLGMAYNARGMISRAHQIPEPDVIHLYSQLGEWARRVPDEVGVLSWGNVIARRPPGPVPS
jgi:2-polyprenyl-3-methyl-5-hydroxy-6-metoxy-1,4-benzoquinol methylase